MEGKVPDVSRHPFTVPSASSASPPGPGLSSAGPRWCRACGDACTGHDCPCKAAGCACLCAVLVRKTQSPAVVVKESRGEDRNHNKRPHAVDATSIASAEVVKSGCVSRNADTHRGLFVNGLDDKLLIVKGNVSDLTPGEANLWGQSEEERSPTSPLNSTQSNRTDF